MDITIPIRPKGRPPKDPAHPKNVKYQTERSEFFAALIELSQDPRLDFRVSSRGWCYGLEEYGLLKGDFDKAQVLINDARKSGELPTDICEEDDARALSGVEIVSQFDVEDKAVWLVEDLIDHHVNIYRNASQWGNQDYFIIMAVEKKDLIGLFKPVCIRFGIPLANFRGWSDINSRLSFMRLFQKWEGDGKQCVLLYFGDHDPGGLNISDQLRKNMADLTGTYSIEHGRMDWRPDDLIVDRFGLTYDFIEEQGLTWIDNLITGSGRDLASPRHDGRRNDEHFKPYVQDYINNFGVRKVEANALIKPSMIATGRKHCKQAILKYLDHDSFNEFLEKEEETQDELREEVAKLIEAA